MSTEISTAIEPSNGLTLKKVWSRLEYLIQRSFEESETTLIEALPVSGKSYGVTKWAKQTGKDLTVFAQRHDLLDEYEERCEDWGLSFRRFPSFIRDCDSFDEDGEPMDHAAEELLKDYKSGRSGVELHAEYSGLCCQSDGECPFVANRGFDTDKYDVLLGTFRHAYRSKWIKGRYVAFDEFPGDAYLRKFEEGIAPVISAYLKDEDQELPFRDYHDLLKQIDKPDVQATFTKLKNETSSRSFDYSHVRRSPSSKANALAPIAMLAEYEMEFLDNGWGYSDLQNGRIAVRNPKSNKWTFLLPPNLSSAESVIGLDGTPNRNLWELTLNEQIQRFTLLDEDERKTYIQDVLGYRFIKTTEDWKAIQSGMGASPPKDLAYIEGIANRECRTPALISSQKSIRQYDSKGLNEITDTVEHYNNLKGMNKFGTERLGIVLGCPHPGDDEIEKWAALAGESAERKEVNGVPLTGKETDYGPFGNEVMHTLVHDEVFQAAMRFGRDKVDGTRGGTVYLHTSAVPNWLPVENQIAKVQSWLTEEDGMKDTIDAIRSLEGWQQEMWKATDLYARTYLYARTSISERRVRDCLDDLDEEDYIEFEGKWGRGEPKHYSNICLEESGQFGHVEFAS